MSRTVRVALAFAFATSALLGYTLATPGAARAASVSWGDCAARPVPSPVARPADSALVSLVQKRVTNWQQARRTKYAGLSATIRWDDGRVVNAVSGLADKSSGRAVTPATPFSLASVSKPFTAAIALLLDACGLMPLTTRASSLVAYADVRPEATIEDLLRHEAGMSDWLTDKYSRMDWLISHPNGKVGPATAVQHLLPRGEIGTFNYSNSSLTLVTLAAERATGATWEQLMNGLLLTPLGLTETGFGPIDGAARPHMWMRGALRPFGQRGWGPTRSVAAVLRGAGDLFSTPRDLARFGELLWGNRLLEGSQTQLINGIANLTGRPWSYTVGTMMDRSWLGTLRTYGHTGGYSGVSTTVRHVPELGVTIAVTANGMGTFGGYADDLAINLIDLVDTPAPSSAQAIAGETGAGITAAVRANPEPFAIETPSPADTCGDGSTLSGGSLGWLDLSSVSASAGETPNWSGRVTAVAEAPDGRLIVGGLGLTRVDGASVGGLAARSPKSGAWSAFGSLTRADGSRGSVTTLVVDTERRRLFVGGDFTAVTAKGRRVAANGIAVFDFKTGRWSPLASGLGGSVLVRSISLDQASGRIAIGGRFKVPGKGSTSNVVIWDETKGWIPLNASAKNATLSGLVEAVALTASGIVHASGHLVVGEGAALVARWSPSVLGWSATATNSTLGDAPHTLALEATGALIAGTGVGWYGTPLVRESVISGYGWERLGGGAVLPRRTPWISALTTAPDGRVLIGGSFTTAGSTAAVRLALWDAAAGQFSALGGGLPIEPDAIASSANSLVYAALRLRSAEPGGTGRTCITAWGAPAPSTPAAPTLTVKRTAITVRWSAPSAGSAPFGWVAAATATGHTTRSCSVAAPALTCVIANLDPSVSYKVSLRAYSIPAGPSAQSAVTKIKTAK